VGTALDLMEMVVSVLHTRVTEICRSHYAAPLVLSKSRSKPRQPNFDVSTVANLYIIPLVDCSQQARVTGITDNGGSPVYGARKYIVRNFDTPQ
jgi:hypothetical protein